MPAALLGSGFAIATPRRVAALMAGLLDVEPEHAVYDPCCGAGRLLLAADTARRRAAAVDSPGRVLGGLYGQEIQPVALALARAAMRRRGLRAYLAGGNTLRSPAFLDDSGQLLRVDRAIANPDWGRPVPEAVYAADPYGRFPYGAPGYRHGDWTWVQHMLAHLRPGGRAVLATGAEVGWRGLGSTGPSTNDALERAVRERLVKAGHVHAVVSHPWPLSRPPGLVTRAARPWLPRGVVLVLGSAPREGTLLIDPRPLVRAYQQRRLTAPQVTDEIIRVHNERLQVPGLSTVVSASELLERGGDLTPARYLHVPAHDLPS